MIKNNKISESLIFQTGYTCISYECALNFPVSYNIFSKVLNLLNFVDLLSTSEVPSEVS